MEQYDADENNAGKLSDTDKARALARFRSLRGRGVRLSFVPFGPIVLARQPAELQQMSGTGAADDFIMMPTESHGQKPTH